MNYMSIAVLRTAKLLTAFAVAATLAGCMITSKEELVTDAEGQQIWPATVYVYGYEEDKEAAGSYKRADDEALQFAMDGNSYKSADGSMTLRFVPLGEADTYLLAMVAADGSMYGTAVYRNNIISANVIVGDADPAAVVDAEKASGADGGALAGVTVEEGGVVVNSRPALDHVIKMAQDGKLTLGGLVMYVDEKPDAAAPAKIVPDGDFWKAGS